MSLFQCEECGCVDNSATSMFNVRNNKRLTPEEFLGRELCCVCGPQTFASGEPISKINGEWHNLFERTFLPKGEWVEDGTGDLTHKDTGETDYLQHEIFPE